MTNLEKIEAEERKQQRIIDNNYCCGVCEKQFSASELQLAHIIPKHVNHIKKWGLEVIHHPLNIVLTCNSKQGKCNDSVMLNPNSIPGLLHIKRIQDDLDTRKV